jgi:hypothetical protein
VVVVAPRVRGESCRGGGGGEGAGAAVPRDRGGRGGGQGWSDRRMKTYEEDEAVGRSCDRGIQFASTSMT